MVIYPFGRRVRFCSPRILLSVGLLAAGPPASASTVFINEIHYDNLGADVGEAVEIAGPAGTLVSGWKLYLYNGNDGSNYRTRDLDGRIPDQGNGFGSLSFGFAANGLQNGAPDGVALVDAVSAVVEFLSYEGSFTATTGPAAGLISTPIGVAEAVDTAPGLSLQRVGYGQLAADFQWAGPQPQSFGSINAGQGFVPIPATLPLLISGIAALGCFGRRSGCS